jgi:hypothetical protein
MSLDIYLSVIEPVIKRGTGVFIRESGKNIELTVEQVRERFPDSDVIVEQEFETNEVFGYNITHNLGPMAKAAGIYMELWRPEELGITKAVQLIEPLREGLHRLKVEPNNYKELNPDNGWGDYEGLVKFVSSYLDACYDYPDADVKACR